MKKFIFILFPYFLFVACTTHQKDISIKNYYSSYKNDSLLIDIVSYIDKLPENEKEDNRFNLKNRIHYIEGFKTRFQFVNYYITKDSVHYFAALLKTPSLYNKKRLIAGKFKIKNNSIIEFDEVLITKKNSEQKLILLKDSLFYLMIENKEITHQEIEWPNKTIHYSKTNHKWNSI